MIDKDFHCQLSRVRTRCSARPLDLLGSTAVELVGMPSFSSSTVNHLRRTLFLDVFLDLQCWYGSDARLSNVPQRGPAPNRILSSEPC